VDFENMFPQGASWETRYGGNSVCTTATTNPSSFVTGDTYGTDGINHCTGSISSSDYSIDLKPYSITIIKYRQCAQSVSVKATATSICVGEPVTLYFSGSSNGTYNVSTQGLISANHLTLTGLSAGTHAYNITDGGSGCSSDNEPISITVYSPPTLTATANTSLLCADPLPSAVTLSVDQTSYPICWNYSNLEGRYGMFQTGQTSYLYSTAIGEDIDAYPTYSQTYSAVMNYNGCTCQEASVEVNVLFAEAGENLWICDDVDCSSSGPDHICPSLGISSAAYPSGTSFSWVVQYENLSGSTSYCSTCLSASTVSNPTFKPTSGPGYYNATLTVTKTIDNVVCETSDEVVITVITCCYPQNALAVFDPYPYPANTYLGGNYPNTLDFFNTIKSSVPSNMIGTYLQTNAGDAGNSVVYDSNDSWGKIKDLNNLTNDQIVVNGKLNIDKNLFFYNCPNITFGPDSRIEVSKNAILQLEENSTLKSCGDRMWEGIIYDNNLIKEEANISPADYMGGLRIISSNVEDAKLALNTTRDSRFTIIDGSAFDRNYKHVKLENYRFPFEGEISESIFKCNSTMLDPYSLNLRTRYAFELIESDHFGKGENGIKNFTSNTFQQCDQGIHSENTGITIYDNLFTNLGTGIYELYFNDHKPTNKIEILDNDFTEVNLGIDLYSNQKAQGFIQGNNISTENSDMPMVGICIIDVKEIGSEIVVGGEDSGEPNTINSAGWAGIYLNGASNTTVLNNTINILTGITVPAYGIRVENAADTVIISKNTISGPSSEMANKAGISFSMSPNNTIHCNTLNYTEIGIEAIANCLPFITWGNEFKNHEWGFVQAKDIGLGVEGFIGDQPDYNLLVPVNDDLVTGNIFDLSSTRTKDIYSIQSNSQQTKYFTKYSTTTAEEPNPLKVGNSGGISNNLDSGRYQRHLFVQ
ncbi:MAG TPA: right-handed parallel beta-helix repeat-containing protein, partial [Saprospiraceae bacterium]|nr:right-handed parallel beta-helix repeat-containing protein [Saprospiraceae bacterium]